MGSAGRHEVVIGRRDGVQQQPVANQAAVDEQEDRVAVVLLHLRAGDEAAKQKNTGAFLVGRALRRLGQQQLLFVFADIDEFFQRLAAEDLKHALAQRRDGRDVQQFAIVVAKFERLVGVGQAVVGDEGRDVREFGLVGAQELLARGNVEEEVADGDGGAGRERGFVAADHLAAGDSRRGCRSILPAACVSRIKRETQAIEGSASPRKPSVAIESRSFTLESFEVAWRSKASRASSRSMPQPLSVMRMRRRPPDSVSMRNCRWSRHRENSRAVP